MARRSGFSPRSQRSSGVSREWVVGPGGTGRQTSTASESIILGAGLTPTTNEITVMRTRGLFDVSVQGRAGTDGDGMFGAVGIGKVTDPAFQIGITAIPTPITEAEWSGWLWHSFFSVHDQDISLAPGPGYHQRIEIDSKAMRKLTSSEVFVAVVEVVEIGSLTIAMYLDTRLLIQDSGR